MDLYSYLGNADISVIEDLYKKYRDNPEEVELQWKQFFQGFDFARTHYPEPDALF